MRSEVSQLIILIGFTYVLLMTLLLHSRKTPEASGVAELSVPSSNTRIPKILHQVFKSDSPYDDYRPYINSCLTHNPDWKYFLWRDVDAESFIRKRLPLFSKTYRKYKDNLERSDSIRYFVLYFIGGIYLDMDVECLKPMPEWLTDLPAFIDQERPEQTRILFNKKFSAMNSAMGSAPGHPFFKKMIEAMMTVNSTNVMTTTGPELLTRVYEAHEASGDVPNVKMLDHRIMSPLMDPGYQFKALCNINKQESRRLWREKGCEELRWKNWSLNDTNSETVCAHRFSHFGYKHYKKARKNPFNMRRTFGDRIKFWTE